MFKLSELKLRMYMYIHTCIEGFINSGGKSGLEGVVTWKYNSFLY